ncbi:MAG: phasin family protein [Gammaproteobacteria bacterium]|nr:phasin family protein [Gammaproteobacteria bacterium]
MAKGKSSKKRDSGRTNEVAEQLEHAFLAGLGALSNTQKAGSKAFEKLVEQGQSFRKQTTNKTESLIDDVQDAIRDMADDAQSKASGLLDQMRETPQMEKFQSVFDARVESALDRIGVASKKDLDKLNAKLDKVLKAGQKKKRAAKKVAKKVTRKAPAKKATTKKRASSRKVSAKKASAKKTSKKSS